MKTVIIDYGAGNTQSVIFALQRIGVNPILSSDANEIQSADKVILPGVGHALAAMQHLHAKELISLIPNLKQDFLGVCLGQQLMCTHSAEGNTECLGIFDVPVLEFPATEKVPHMGWNQLSNLKSSLFTAVPDKAFVYHVHSFYVPDNAYSIATCNYILPFASAMQKNNFYATQFHPEKSGLIGEQILKNFIAL